MLRILKKFSSPIISLSLDYKQTFKMEDLNKRFICTFSLIKVEIYFFVPFKNLSQLVFALEQDMRPKTRQGL